MPHHRLLPIAAVALALVLAGCLTDPGTPETGTDAPAGTKGTSDQAPTDDPYTPPDPAATEQPNRPPTAALSVSNATGTAPFTVTFTIDGDDPDDGDRPLWSLDVNNDGTPERQEGFALRTLDWTYQNPGNYTAVLTVTDGEYEVNDTVTVQVSAPVPPETPEPIVFEGTITGAWAADAGYLPGPNNHTFELLVPVGNITLNISFGETAFDLDYALVAPNGETVASAANFNEPTGNIYDTSEPSISTSDPAFTQMTGTWTVSVYPGIAVNGTYTVTVTFA